MSHSFRKNVTGKLLAGLFSTKTAARGQTRRRQGFKRRQTEPLEVRAMLSVIPTSVDMFGSMADDHSGNPSVSANGRYVAFDSRADGLVDNDNNDYRSDVYVRDLELGLTTLVSVGISGESGTGTSLLPVISPDGRYVAFLSTANDLVANDQNSGTDVFVRDLQLGSTTLVTISPSGSGGNANSWHGGDGLFFSSDGRFLAFESEASDLVPHDTNGEQDIFVRDLQAGVTTLVSVNPSGSAGNGKSRMPGISANGRFVAFLSSASDLTSNTTADGYANVFIRDLVQGTTSLVSVSTSDNSGSGDSYQPTISDDGRFVAFESDAADLIENDLNSVLDIFVRDLLTGTTLVASATPAGSVGNGVSAEAKLTQTAGSFCFAVWRRT